MAVKSAAEFVYSGLGEGEVLQKWAESGVISAVMVRIADRWGRPRWNSVQRPGPIFILVRAEEVCRIAGPMIAFLACYPAILRHDSLNGEWGAPPIEADLRER